MGKKLGGAPIYNGSFCHRPVTSPAPKKGENFPQIDYCSGSQIFPSFTFYYKFNFKPNWHRLLAQNGLFLKALVIEYNNYAALVKRIHIKYKAPLFVENVQCLMIINTAERCMLIKKVPTAISIQPIQPIHPSIGCYLHLWCRFFLTGMLWILVWYWSLCQSSSLLPSSPVKPPPKSERQKVIELAQEGFTWGLGGWGGGGWVGAQEDTVLLVVRAPLQKLPIASMESSITSTYMPHILNIQYIYKKYIDRRLPRQSPLAEANNAKVAIADSLSSNSIPCNADKYH